MKRQFGGILFCVVLASLFVGLAFILYGTQSKIRESEREKAEKRVRDLLDRIGSDFDRQIQGTYFNFQIDSTMARDVSGTELRARYELWRQRAEFPDLIRGFVFRDDERQTEPVAFKAEDGGLVPDQRSVAAIAGLQDPDKVSFTESSIILKLQIFQTSPIVTPVIVQGDKKAAMPKIAMPRTVGELFVILDRDVATRQLMRSLVDRHAAGEPYVFSAATVSNELLWGDEPSSFDGERGIFSLSPNDLMFFSDRALMIPRGGGGASSTVVLNSKVETRSFRQSEEPQPAANAQDSKMTIEVKRSGVSPARIFATRANDGPEPARLLATHTLGSIDAAVNAEMLRSLAIGYSMLLIVGVAVFSILFSAYRSRALARRQLEFISSVSHEFRTPLAVIYSAAENIADGVPLEREALTKYGGIIKAEGRKLSSMVEEILEFAGARSGGLQLRRERTDVECLVTAGVDGARTLLNEKGIDPESNIPPGLRPVNVDRSAMVRAIQNLVANAVKYCGSEPWIGISVEQGPSTTTIEVRDRGIGIDEKDLRHIFEPFYRAKSVVDAQIRGNGLGLSVVKQIAAAHNGSIRVHSEPGSGSRFVLEIPNAEA